MQARRRPERLAPARQDGLHDQSRVILGDSTVPAEGAVNQTEHQYENPKHSIESVQA